jgi:hypothetical protein
MQRVPRHSRVAWRRQARKGRLYLMGTDAEIALLRELVNAKDALVHKTEEVVHKTEEVVRAKDELLCAKEKAAAAELRLARSDLRRAADDAVRTAEGVKLRGVVEYVAKVHSGAVGAQKGLNRLFTSDAQLQKLVAAFSAEFKLLPEVLSRSSEGLYHTLSKELHGSRERVEVHEAHWRSPGERAMLCALLERFSVTYVYMNFQDDEVPSPYAATAKLVLEGELPQEQE